MKRINGDKTFHAVAYVIVGILAIVAILPFLLIVIASFTYESTLVQYGYSFFPKKWSADAYIYLKTQATTILKAYGVSIAVTAIGTCLSVLLTSMLAYPLSRKDFVLSDKLAFFVFFTMLFNGCVVP